jgi:UDP-N-acetylglucosamine 2-epimerase
MSAMKLRGKWPIIVLCIDVFFSRLLMAPARYGEVNSTMAAALVCAKLLVPVAHVEARLRSFDRSMPEEVNRLVTDQLSDVLFSHCEDADILAAGRSLPCED